MGACGVTDTTRRWVRKEVAVVGLREVAEATWSCGVQNWFNLQRGWRGIVRKYFGHLSLLWVHCDPSNSRSSLP